jgi:chromosome segregation ATPase
MKKSNEAMEIEQLKNKIEKYRKALSSLSSENSSEDIHLKRKVQSLEKNVEQLNERVQELAHLVDEGITNLSNEIKELAEKNNEQLIGKKDTATPRLKSTHSSLSEFPSSISIQPDTQSSSYQSTVPTFKRLRQLAALQPSVQPNESPMPPRYHAPAVSTNTSEIRELKPITHEEINRPSRGEDSNAATSLFVNQSSREHKDIEKSQSAQPTTQLYARDEIQDSPFWKKFKKK